MRERKGKKKIEEERKAGRQAKNPNLTLIILYKHKIGGYQSVKIASATQSSPLPKRKFPKGRKQCLSFPSS